MGLTKTSSQEIASYEAVTTILSAISERIKNPQDSKKITEDALAAVREAKEAHEAVRLDRAKFKQESDEFAANMNAERRSLTALSKDLEDQRKELNKLEADIQIERKGIDAKRAEVEKKAHSVSARESEVSKREEKIDAAEAKVKQLEAKLADKEKNLADREKIVEDKETKMRQALGG